MAAEADALDRTTFVSHVIGMMSKVVDHQSSTNRLNELEKQPGTQRRVEEARFALGQNDGAYLRTNVMPLQTTLSGCDDRPIVEGLSPEIRHATQVGVVSAMQEDSRLRVKKLEGQLEKLVKRFALGLSILSAEELDTIAASLQATDLRASEELSKFNASLKPAAQDAATIYNPLTDFEVVSRIKEQIDPEVPVGAGKAKPASLQVDKMQERYQTNKKGAARLSVGSDDDWSYFKGESSYGFSFAIKYYEVLTKLSRLVIDNRSELAHQKKLAAIKDRLDKEVKSADDLNRSKRRAVWNDALRESCICQDRLYAFVRQLSGTISENVDAICQIDEGLLVRQQREQRENQQRLTTQAAQEQMNLVRNVFGAVLRDSGLSLGIDTRDSPSQLKVVSSTLRKQASEIASGASGTTDGYFSNSVRLENLLSSGTGEITLEELFEKLGAVGNAIQRAARVADSQYEGETDVVSLDFLSAPRNSMLLRYKPESMAAIRQAFQYFQREMKYQSGIYSRHITAFELIEGNDDTLSTAFATFCAHVLVHSRMYSSGTAMYIGAWPAAANAQQLKISLQRLVTCAKQYEWTTSTPAFGSERGRDQYFAAGSRSYALF